MNFSGKFFFIEIESAEVIFVKKSYLFQEKLNVQLTKEILM